MFPTVCFCLYGYFDNCVGVIIVTVLFIYFIYFIIFSATLTVILIFVVITTVAFVVANLMLMFSILVLLFLPCFAVNRVHK